MVQSNRSRCIRSRGKQFTIELEIADVRYEMPGHSEAFDILECDVRTRGITQAPLGAHDSRGHEGSFEANRQLVAAVSF